MPKWIVVAERTQVGRFEVEAEDIEAAKMAVWSGDVAPFETIPSPGNWRIHIVRPAEEN